MIFNTFAVLDLFLVILRLIVGFLVLGLCLLSWRRGQAAPVMDQATNQENRGYLLFSLAFLLVGLHLASWPLFYLLLESYVPEWPGVMCIYGVTQVGAGSMNASRFLPVLLQILQAMKPALVFLGGAWFVFYLVNRQTRTAPLNRLILVVMTCLALVGIAEGGIEAAYLLIPKKEEHLALGCCTEALAAVERAARFSPQGILGEDSQSVLTLAFFGINLGMILALFLATRTWTWAPTRGRLTLLLFGSLASLAISALFLVEVAAPGLLGLPFHHCPYDLVGQVPESLIGAALVILGSFAIGWATLIDWTARCPETIVFLDEAIRWLLFVGLLGYLGAMVLTFIELALA